MKKSTRRRPELETLETVVLMSTVSAEAHHAAKPVAPAGPVQLLGTFPLKPRTTPASPSDPAQTDLVGQGNLAGLGHSFVDIDSFTFSQSRTSIDVISRSRGIVDLTAPISLPARGATVSQPYLVGIGGEDSFDNGVKPTGTVTISDIVGKNGKDSYVLKLS